MSDMPPRRSRPPLQPRERSLPLIPILIAVIVVGFVIGAGLSLAGKRKATDRTVVVATRTPVPTEAPVTPAPSEKPTAVPTDAPSHAPVVAPPRATASRTPTAAATAIARPPASAEPTVTAAPAVTAATAAAVTAAPATRVRTAAPRVVATARVVAPIAVAPVARRTQPPPLETAAPATTKPDVSPPADDTDSEFSKLASAVVRQYIGAVSRGDTETARAAFGSNASGEHLAETGIVDASTRIQHVEARSAGDNVTVNVDMRTASGLYFGQYTVHRTPSGAALITTHAINKL